MSATNRNGAATAGHHPLVSVALCTYNGARFIETQLRSICEQTLLPDEIVLSDDASRDDVVAVARRVHAACAHAAMGDVRPRLRVLQNDAALGVTRNFEQAVRACEGEFVALCDQDDIWHPEKIERLVAALQGGPRQAMLVHADARLIDSQGQPLGATLFGSLGVSQAEFDSIHRGEAFNVFLRRNLVTGATTVFRRELLSQALPFPREWLHDEWLGLVAAAQDGVDVVQWSAIDYRQHGTNQVGARRLGFVARVRKALERRGDDALRRRAKAEILVGRLQALEGRIDASKVRQARGKLAHQERRAALPRARIARFLPILLALASGSYARYDYGLQGAIRDLLASP